MLKVKNKYEKKEKVEHIWEKGEKKGIRDKESNRKRLKERKK